MTRGSFQQCSCNAALSCLIHPKQTASNWQTQHFQIRNQLDGPVF
jgi:hypothetical protein